MKYLVILLLVCSFIAVSADDLGTKEELLQMIEESYDDFYWGILKEFLPPNSTVETQPNLRKSESSKLKVDMSELFTYVKEMFEDTANPLIDTFKKINALALDSLSHRVHNEISRLAMSAYVYYVRAAAFTSESTWQVVKAIRGDSCFPFPNLEKVLKIFAIKGGKICPFSDVLMRDVVMVDKGDRWVVSFPLVYNTVDMDFAVLEVDLGFLGTHSTPEYHLHANEVQLGVTMTFSKNIIPFPRSFDDIDISVEGCDGYSPHSGWIMRQVIKYAMKLCDPVINSMLKATIFFVPLQVKIMKWLSRVLLKKDNWAEELGQWIIKTLGPILAEKLEGMTETT